MDHPVNNNNGPVKSIPAKTKTMRLDEGKKIGLIDKKEPWLFSKIDQIGTEKVWLLALLAAPKRYIGVVHDTHNELFIIILQ